jgi:thiamine-phosphate pyrophosphorylase
MDWTLLAIVDAGFVPEERLEECIAAAARGGATWLQVRAKALATGDLVRYSRVAARAARAVGLPFLINDRADVARVVGADGVHVGAEDLPVSEARRLLGPRALVGATAREAGAARRAEVDGASYLGVGPQFASPTKPSLVPLPEGRVAEIREACALPLVGIGGIDAMSAAIAARRGLDGIAVVSALWRGPSPEDAARRIAREFREGRRS